MSELKRCTKCVMPETWSGITFDEQGVCNICRNYEKKKGIDWEARQEALELILYEYKDRAKKTGNKYDCLVGYSGGKDTAYTLYAMVKKWDMRPLCVTWDHGFKLDQGAEYNLQEIPKILNVDHLRFTIGNDLRNALCRKASEVMGDFCWHCHNGVGAFPARVSKMFDVPLQIWGEPNSDGGALYGFDDKEEQNYEHYKQMFQGGVTPEMVLPDGYEKRDLLPMQWPDEKFPLKAIYLGSYEPWDQNEHARIIEKELGWRPYPFKDFDPKLIRMCGNYRNWDKRDCPYETVRNWQKFIRRGFDKLSFQASKDIRDGLITRDNALEIIKQEGQRPVNMEAFCKETGISESEFYRITKPL